MYPLLLASISALCISLAGSLPLGNLNITAMYIAAKKGLRAGVFFAFGVVVMEMLYLRISLTFVQWIVIHRALFSMLQWITVLLFIVIAVNNLLAARSLKQHKPALQKAHPLLLGILLSAVNPLQLPFWAGWAVYLTATGVIVANTVYYNVFTVSAGAGTLVALAMFILSGKRLSAYIEAHTRRMNFIMGTLFLLLAVYQIFRLI